VVQIAEQFATALSHHRGGRLGDAEGLYRQIIAADPNHVESLHFLGVLAGQTGRVELSANLIGRALALKPDYAEAHCNLGRALAMQGKLAEAGTHFERAASLKPDYTEAHYNLGRVLSEQEKFAAAIVHYDRVLAVRPDLADVWLARGLALQRTNRQQEAIASYSQALARGGDTEVIPYYLASLGAGTAPGAAPRQLVAKSFDQWAERYDQDVLGTLTYRTPDLLFDAMAHVLSVRNLDILDLGCGTGLSGVRFRPFARTLTGVDLSSRMLKVAHDRRIYDSLVCADLIEYLELQSKNFDVAMAADVFVYIGDLSKVFSRVRGALKDSGFFAFSVETTNQQDFVLRSTLKYAHSGSYLRKLANEHSFSLESMESRVIRQDGGIDVVGDLAVLRCS
jgi:predicted TPR repeat methyltransferase